MAAGGAVEGAVRWATETVPGPDGLVCSVDRLASEAGTAVLRAGGNAVDAAIATSAALTVTTPHESYSSESSLAFALASPIKIGFPKLT